MRLDLAMSLLREFREFYGKGSCQRQSGGGNASFIEPKLYGKGSSDYRIYFRQDQLSREALDFLKAMAEKHGLELHESKMKGYLVLRSFILT